MYHCVVPLYYTSASTFSLPNLPDSLDSSKHFITFHRPPYILVLSLCLSLIPSPERRSCLPGSSCLITVIAGFSNVRSPHVHRLKVCQTSTPRLLPSPPKAFQTTSFLPDTFTNTSFISYARFPTVVDPLPLFPSSLESSKFTLLPPSMTDGQRLRNPTLYT